MKINHYEVHGFVKVGQMEKNAETGKKKHNVYVTYKDGFEPKGKIGVYILATGQFVLKIGESENLHNRFQCYESHSGPTNAQIRENMTERGIYDIWFIECPHYTVGFAGVFVNSGISYKQLEKKLLTQYKDHEGSVPIWNKGIQ